MLLDHFHPPLKGRRHRTGFHSRWAGNIAVDLNRQLPPGWFAEPTVHWGIEVDVATFEDAETLVAVEREAIARVFTPSPPARSIAFAQTTDIIEVQVYQDWGDVPLVAAVEFVSPANKDRPETRDAFAAKCEAYLRNGLGLVIVDIVTERSASLHAELLERCGEPQAAGDSLYAAAYRPIVRNAQFVLDIWHEALAVGGSLPSMPLFVKDGPCVEVNLGDTYRQTCDDLRIARMDLKENGAST